jgi:hypothetical protein
MTLTLLALVASVGSHPARTPSARVTNPATASVSKPDLRGNDITAAVATYKLDSTGVLYEEHSPQTEVPRLGAPKS